MRTATYEIPPQEVGFDYFFSQIDDDDDDDGDVADNRNIRDPSPGGGL